MENITTGHWIFAGVFFAAFIVYLFWAYRKDIELHRLHYRRAWYVLVTMILILFTFYVFKRIL